MEEQLLWDGQLLDYDCKKRDIARKVMELKRESQWWTSMCAKEVEPMVIEQGKIPGLCLL